MFSRKLLIFVGAALFLAINFIVITMSSKETIPASGVENVFISITSPFQLAVSRTLNYTQNIWRTYFLTVLAVKENLELKKQLGTAMENRNRYFELELENTRLKKFVDFSDESPNTYVAAQVIARDPSPWFKTVMIDKGKSNGLTKGCPVLVSEGIVGQIIKVANNYSRVLLIIDRNSAVDALVQNSRVRGIVKGKNENRCSFVYALRKDEVKEGEMLISSGLDQVYPKGLKIGKIKQVTKVHSKLFQDITIETSVDFDIIEEVLVLKSIQ